MTNLPKVTFLIAHRNYQQYLPDAIKSAKDQTHQNIGICVVDDSSDDQNLYSEIIYRELFENKNPDEEEYQNNQITSKLGPYTSIILKSGPYTQSYARNRGIEATLNETDYYCVLDADDMVCPQKIERMLKLFNMPHIAVVYADYDTINVETDLKAREFKEVYSFTRLREECIVHSGALIKKEAIIETMENGLCFDETLSPLEDYDLWIRISEKYMMAHVAESLTLVRVHPQNSTNTSTEQFRINKMNRIREKILERQNANV